MSTTQLNDEEEKQYIFNLKKLAGMKYHGGETVEHWIEITKVDPRNVKSIEIKNGRCYWTEKAEKEYKNVTNSIKISGRMLTDKTLI